MCCEDRRVLSAPLPLSASLSLGWLVGFRAGFSCACAWNGAVDLSFLLSFSLFPLLISIHFPSLLTHISVSP